MEKVVFEKSNTNKSSEKITKEGEEQNQKLTQLLARSYTILFKASSFFPFNFFPDEITIDLEKVSVLIRVFFFSGEVKTIYIKDIDEVLVDAGLFFATIKIQPHNTKLMPLVITYLHKSEAIKARKIIQGLIVAFREGIDVSKISDKRLVERIEKIGAAQGMKEL